MVDKRILNWILWVAALSMLLAIAIIVSMAVGSASIPLKKLLHAIIEGRPSAEFVILTQIRLPRIVLGMAVGGALSLAGVVLQGLFRNPLVEPYTLGISGGGALGVSIAVASGMGGVLGSFTLPFFGFAGAAAVILIIYFLSMRRGIFKIEWILLIGVMVSFISSSLIMLTMSVARAEDVHGIVFWMMGSLAGSDWVLIAVVSAASLGALVICAFMSLELNAMAMGEEDALHLGVDVERAKKKIFFTAAFLTGVSVSAAGIIGFVGLVIPHFVRLIIGRDHRILIPCSFLGGAAFLIVCDTLARTVIAPMELPVGVITGILGGTIFIYALVGKMRESL